MTRLADGLEVEGPVQAEVFVVWLNGDHLELTGPCGAAPWLIELGEVEHPVAVVERIVPAVLDHGQRIHNMPGTREDVLANAKPANAPTPEPARAEPEG